MAKVIAGLWLLGAVGFFLVKTVERNGLMPTLSVIGVAVAIIFTTLALLVLLADD